MWRRLRPVAGPGVLTTAAILLVFLGIAVSVDYPRTAFGFKGDEATYYTLTYSLALDGDLTFQRRDLVRIWREFHGPEGIFLKQGIDVQGADLIARPPFIRLTGVPDETAGRLYFAKSYVYPVFAAPFVKVFGTNGFLVFHALMLALNFASACAFLRARGSTPSVAAAFAAVFLFATVVPIYFVWLTPELFNFTLVLQAYFLWTYKQALGSSPSTDGRPRWLLSPATDYVAAVLLGIATFSKPTHVILILPLLALPAVRGEWRRLLIVGSLFGFIVATLFGINGAITGDLNYQGGIRKQFYSSTGFPFANPWETFDSKGHNVATDKVPVNVLFHGDTLTVLAWNIWYFIVGRYSGFLPYFFPGIVAVALFLRRRNVRPDWQWLTMGAAALGALGLLLYMPYTYSGGGGPIGNRYFLSFYPLFLFVLPGIRSFRPVIVALAIGALFTTKLVLNPFYTGFHPNEHAKAGPLRLLPIELTLLNDLPVAGDPDRGRRTMAGTPPVAAYFTDDGSYLPEGEFFWVRGGRRADVILRAPAPEVEGTPVPLRIERLIVEISNGAVPNRVRVSDRFGWVAVDLQPREDRVIEVRPGGGVPFKPSIFPTNYVYTVSISTTAGWAPFLDAPGETDDSRYLGARVRIVPIYANR